MLDAKGIEMVRRDQCPLVAHTQATITPPVTSHTQAIIDPREPHIHATMFPRVVHATSALSSLTPRRARTLYTPALDSAP